MNSIKVEIKILRILYAIIILGGFFLFFYYKNDKKPTTEAPKYSYEVIDIEEDYDSVHYDLKIEEKYNDTIITEICNEIKNNYMKLYKIDNITDKANVFEIVFYYNDEIYKTVSNK